MKTELKQPYKQFFGTLANQNRLDIVEALRDSPLNVTALCKKLGFNQTTISHNIRRLETCGFVSAIPNGRERTYKLNQQTIGILLGLMHEHMDAYCKQCVGRKK